MNTHYVRRYSLFVRYLRHCLKNNGYDLTLAARNCDCWYICQGKAKLGLLTVDSDRKVFSIRPTQGYNQSSSAIVYLRLFVERAIWDYKPQRAQQMLDASDVGAIVGGEA